jgi:hypothetical protein
MSSYASARKYAATPRKRKETMESDISSHPLRTKAEAASPEMPCPPHGPILIKAVEKSAYSASCLACGLEGPKREDGWDAKLAFDEAFGAISQ